MLLRTVLLLTIAGLAADAQFQLPAEPPPPVAAETKPPVPAGPPVIVNTGKPIALEAKCGAEEIAALGLTCSATERCPLYLELADVESAGVKIFVSGNIHSPSSTLSSILLVSEDAGATWMEPAERIPHSVLEHIQFLDFESGWIAGQTILSLPRDPFVLLTTDGGKSWRKRLLYSDTRVGSIDSFSFTSRTSGKAVVDRSQAGEANVETEVLETQTGGDSWTLIEVSSRPATKAPPPSQPAPWRIRADAATNAYRIEKRQSEKWLTVASFLVSAGECKLPEAPSVEPPPQEPEAPEPPPLPKPAPKRPTLGKKPAAGKKP